MINDDDNIDNIFDDGSTFGEVWREAAREYHADRERSEKTTKRGKRKAEDAPPPELTMT